MKSKKQNIDAKVVPRFKARNILSLREAETLVKASKKRITLYTNLFEEIGKIDANFDAVSDPVTVYSSAHDDFLFVLGRSMRFVAYYYYYY